MEITRLNIALALVGLALGVILALLVAWAGGYQFGHDDNDGNTRVATPISV